jgi:hypothetical protein
MQNKFNVFLMLFSAIILVTLSYIAFFNFPSADDFCYASTTKQVGLLQAQYNWYKDWSGRYFSTFLLCVSPLVKNNLFLFRLQSVALIIGFYGAIWLSVKNIASKYITSLDIWGIVSILFVFLINNMVSVNEAFYWLAGALNYTPAFIMLVLFVNVLFTKMIDFSKINMWNYVAFTLVFCISGNNEITMLINFSVLSLYIFYIYFFNREKLNWMYIILLIFHFVCACVVTFCPGNKVRYNKSLKLYNITQSINLALFDTVSIAKNVFKPNYNVLGFIVFFILGAFFYTKYKKSFLSKKVVAFCISIILISLFFVFLGHFTSYTSISYVPPLRALNYLVIYLGISLVVFSFVLGNIAAHYITFSNPLFQNTILYATIIVFLSFSISNSNVNLILNSINSNEIKQFKNENTKRWNFLLQNSGNNKSLQLMALKAKPKFLFFTDIDTNYMDFKNGCMSSFWNTGAIHLINDNWSITDTNNVTRYQNTKTLQAEPNTYTNESEWGKVIKINNFNPNENYVIKFNAKPTEIRGKFLLCINCKMKGESIFYKDVSLTSLLQKGVTEYKYYINTPNEIACDELEIFFWNKDKNTINVN